MELPAPGLDLLARFWVDLGAPIEIGDAGFGRRRIIPIVGGRFEGPRLNGSIRSLGADWQGVDGEGTARIDTRYLLELADGALVSIATRGYRSGPPGVLAALAAGEEVDPARYYFRILLEFETAAEPHRWLNRTLCIGVGARLANQVVYDAYALT